MCVHLVTVYVASIDTSSSGVAREPPPSVAMHYPGGVLTTGEIVWCYIVCTLDTVSYHFHYILLLLRYTSFWRSKTALLHDIQS